MAKRAFSKITVLLISIIWEFPTSFHCTDQPDMVEKVNSSGRKKSKGRKSSKQAGKQSVEGVSETNLPPENVFSPRGKNSESVGLEQHLSRYSKETTEVTSPGKDEDGTVSSGAFRGSKTKKSDAGFADER